MAKYKRYFTGSDNRRNRVQAGKGSDRRDAHVSEQQLARNWCRTFGHKNWNRLLDRCDDCGITMKEALAEWRADSSRQSVK